MKTIAIVLLGSAMAIAAGPDPKGFELWTSSQLQGIEKQLAAKGAGKAVTLQQLARFDNHSAELVHREGNGGAELHDVMTDVFFVESGEATLVLGGTIVAPKTTAPHETRGETLNGGDEKKIGPGDVVHIPPGIPHQLKVAPGQKFSYFVFKIEAK